jgi:nitrite reductase (NADH) large subunit
VTALKSWRCTVCGYVHQGADPPDCCPVCGAPAADFETFAEPPPAATPAASQFRCLDCNYVHDGGAPAGPCPVCGAPPDRFEAVTAVPRTAAEDGGIARRTVIVGAGIAGISAAEAVREAAPGAEITLLSHESALPYYRLNLTRYLAGDIERGSLPIRQEDWYAQNGIRLRTGCTAADLDPAASTLRLLDGESLAYDRLILAMGSHPYVPPLAAPDCEGVITLRTDEDADRILEAARRGARIVCIGGGILGMETAGALARRGADITLLERHTWLMPRQLNRAAAAYMRRHLEGLGVTLRVQARTRAVEGAGRSQTVLLEDDTRLPAELVILAAGVRPNTHLARRAGLEVHTGVVVNAYLQSSHPAVYAAGDVAEHNGQLYGAWGASQYQGTIAGINAVGGTTRFGGLPRSNTLKVLGLDLLSIGTFEAPDGSYDTFELADDHRYATYVFGDGTLAGAILVGDLAPAPAVKKAVESRTNFSALLAGRPSAAELHAHFANPR